MPNIKLTAKLIDKIKTERTENKISAKELSESLERSPSYISTLERGKIDFIEPDLLEDIFRKILNTSQEKLEEFMNTLFSEMEVQLTDKEKEDYKNIKTYELIIRKIPITKDIIEDIKSRLDQTEKTTTDLIDIINSNLYLEEKETLNDNELFIYTTTSDNGVNVGWSYKFNVNLNYIENILNGTITSVNYITMLGIIYNLLLLEDVDYTIATAQAEIYLKKHKFYTLSEIQSELKKSETEPFYDIDSLPDYEKEYNTKFKDLLNHFKFMRTTNIEYSLKAIESLNLNFKFDMKFMFALFNLPFFSLKSLDFKQRQEVLIKINKILKETIVNKDTYTEN
jgi:transcriptional regulator with XRE-family HTH domain